MSGQDDIVGLGKAQGEYKSHHRESRKGLKVNTSLTIVKLGKTQR